MYTTRISSWERKMEMLACCVIVLIAAFYTDASRIHHDPELLKRIPEDVRRNIDELVNHHVQRAVATHFQEPGSPTFSFQDVYVPKKHLRLRREVTNATSNGTGVFSAWSDFGACSVKCGGGQQVRYRTCSAGDCRTLGSFTETRKCGRLPCVAGSYILDSVVAFDILPIPGAKFVKFFNIQGIRYFGYITDTQLQIQKWSSKSNSFVQHQTISVTSGISFDILNTYPRTYIVVLQKAVMIFPGRFSKMYYYDPWSTLFKITSAVTIDVWEPSALKTFDVFGTAFLGIVNYQTRMVSNFGFTQKHLVCTGQTRTISCQPGSIINVVHAMYGRVSNYECASGVDVFMSWFSYYAYTCVVPGAKEKVSALCDGKQSCQLTANPVYYVTAGAQSCAQTKNYLRVVYTCNTISFMGRPIFYKWDGVGLSLVSGEKLITYGATDIEAFSIHDIQYIAVANYNDQKTHHLDSEIYMYNLDSGRFESLQRIRTDGAVDFEFFSVGEGLAREYFLAVANHVKVLPSGVRKYTLESVIYKWNWNLFVPFQCVKTYGAKKWTALTGAKGRFTLAMNNLYGNTTFYSYDGWRFNVANVQPKENIFEKAIALYVNKQADEPMFLVQNTNPKYNKTRNLYKTRFMKTFPKFELLEATLRAVQELNRSVYEDLIPKAKIFNTSYNTVKDDIVFLDNMTFTAHKTFSKIRVIGNTTVQYADITNVNLSPADLKTVSTLKVLNQTITAITGQVDAANGTLANVVTKSSEQVITSRKSFPGLNASSLTVNRNIDVGGTINGVDISGLTETALYLNESATVAAGLYFRNASFHNVTVSGTFGNIRTEDVVSIDHEETIFGEKTFQNVKFEGGVKSNINVKLLNGINTSDFVTIRGDQYINASYFFNDTALVLGNVSVTGTVNNKDLLAVVRDTVMTDSLDVVAINASKRFRKLNILEDLNMRDNTTINGIDVSELSTIGLHMSSDSFNSTVTFASNITFLSNVSVGGSVNGLNLSDVVFTNVDSLIVGDKVIAGNINTTAGIKVHGKINEVNLSNILDTVNNQTISGRKKFTSDLYIISDIATNGLVDGVNVSDAYLRSLLMNTTQNITGYKTFNNLAVNTLELQSCSHDCRLLDALNNIKYQCAKKSNQVINITGSKHFRNLKIEGSSEVSGVVNTVDMPGDLLVQGKNQNISGRNVFLKNVIIGNVDMTRINNVNVSSMFKKALSKSNLMIKGRKVFKDNVVVNGDTTVTREINGIDFGDVVKTFKDETVSGRKRFVNRVSVGELSAKTMTTLGLIDGVNLTALENELLSLKKEKIVKGTKIFKRGVSFAGNWSVPGLIDGVNLTELYNVAMTLDGDQRISGTKTFERVVSVRGALSVRGLVDNVNLTDLAARAVLTNSGNANQTIKGNVTFRTVTLHDNMVVSGLINGHNLTELVNDTLMKTGDQVVNGKHSINNLSVVGNVSVTGMVNGLNLSEEVVSLQAANVISTQKNFTKTLKVDILNTKEINGLNFTSFAKRAVYINQDAVINGFVTFKSNLNVEKELIVRELINKLNLTNIIQTTILKAGDQDIKQPVHFADVIFQGDLLNTHNLNARNFTSFANNVIYKCSGPNKNITGTLKFNAMSVRGVLTLINLIVNGKINTVDLNLLNEQTVKDSGDYIIRGYKQVNGELTVRNLTTGSLNNFRFPDDFVSISGESAITAKKTFMNDVVVSGDVNITSRKTLNTVDLSESSRKMVRLNGNHTVSSTVQFRGEVIVKRNMNAKMINGVNVSRDVMLLQDGNQTVTASKIFSDVQTNGGIFSGNNVNGFNLAKIEKDSLVSGRKNIVQGKLTVVGNVVVKGNAYSPKVDGVDVSNITSHFEGFNSISNYLDSHIPLSNNSLGRTRAIIKQLSASIKHVHQSLDYFVDNQEVMLPYISTSIDVHTSGSEVWLAAGALSDVRGNPCVNTSVFVRSHSNDAHQPFINTHSVLSNAVSDVKFVNEENRMYIVSSSNRASGTCLSQIPVTEQRSVAYIYDTNSKLFKKYASARTNAAISVSVDVFRNEVFALFTNTYFNSSACVKQSLHSLNSSAFSLIGSFTSCNVIKSIILSQDSTKSTIAVLGTNYFGYRQLEIIDIFRNGSTTVKQTIATHFASDVTQISSGEMKFIVIANTYDSSEEALAISYTVPIAVYRLNRWGLYDPYQDIAVTSAFKVHPLRIGIYNYLAIATVQQKIIILKHKGASKWNIELTVPIQGYASIKDIETWSYRNEVYMAVLSSDTWNKRYPSKIRVMRGYLTSTVEGSDIIKKVAEV